MPFVLLIIKKDDYEKNTITYRNYLGGTTFANAQGDYYIKKAQSYQREAEYYQKKVIKRKLPIILKRLKDTSEKLHITQKAEI